MPLNHQVAKAHACAGFFKAFGTMPTLSEVQCLMGVAYLETSYGYGWKGAGKGSYNMGAITAGRSWKGDTFPARDSRPATPDEMATRHDAKGNPLEIDSTGNVWYSTPFRKYATEADGWADLATLVYISNKRASVLAAATAGDVYGVSAALYATKYYTGRASGGAKARIDRHHKAMMNGIMKAAQANGDPLPDGKPLPPPTIRRGDRGDDVKELQRLLNEKLGDDPLVVDGIFGPICEKAVKAFQSAAGLAIDGIVGSETWRALR